MSARLAAGTHLAVGTRVRVLAADAPGHIRTPWYARGKIGVVERYCGEFRNPEELAYGRYDASLRGLYRVRFAQRELWPEYDGGPADSVDIDLYEHWLEALPR